MDVLLLLYRKETGGYEISDSEASEEGRADGRLCKAEERADLLER